MTALADASATAAATPAKPPAELRVSTPHRVYQADRLTLDEMIRISHELARADLQTSNPHTLLAKILFGQEIGIGPMRAVEAIHMIDGKPTVDASVIAAKIKASEKYDYKIIQHDDTHCTIAFYEGDKLLGASEFTVKDAERAKLYGKKSATWEKYPRNMTFSRSMTNGQAWYCGDVMGGRVNSPEEIGALVTVDKDGVQHVVVNDVGTPILDRPEGTVDTTTGEVTPPASNVVQIDPQLMALRQDLLEQKVPPAVVTRVLRGFGVERITALPLPRIAAFRRAVLGAAARAPHTVNPPPAAGNSAHTAPAPGTTPTSPAPASSTPPAPAASAAPTAPTAPPDGLDADEVRLRQTVTERIADLALPPEIVTKMIIEASNGKARSLDDRKLKADALARLLGRLKSLQVQTPAPAATPAAPAAPAEPVDRIATIRQFAIDNNLRYRVQAMLADLHVKTLADIPPSELDAFERKLRDTPPPAPKPAAKIGTPAHLR